MKPIKYENMTDKQKKIHDSWIRDGLVGNYDEKFAKAMAKQLGVCARGSCETEHKCGYPLIFEGSQLVCSKHAFERLREISEAPLAPKRVVKKKQTEDSWREISLL